MASNSGPVKMMPLCEVLVSRTAYPQSGQILASLLMRLAHFRHFAPVPNGAEQDPAGKLLSLATIAAQTPRKSQIAMTTSTKTTLIIFFSLRSVCGGPRHSVFLNKMRKAQRLANEYTQRAERAIGCPPTPEKGTI